MRQNKKEPGNGHVHRRHMDAGAERCTPATEARGREKGRYGVESYLEYKTIYVTYEGGLQ